MTAAVLEYRPSLSHGWFFVAIFIASYPLWHREFAFPASVVSEVTAPHQIVEPRVAEFPAVRELTVPAVSHPAGSCAGQH
jgi:hypothetical protein